MLAYKDIRYRQSDSCICAPLGEDTAILNSETGIYFGLNTTGTTVWNTLTREQTIHEITAAVLEKFEVDENQCLRDVIALLEELRTRGLVQIVGDAR